MSLTIIVHWGTEIPETLEKKEKEKRVPLVHSKSADPRPSEPTKQEERTNFLHENLQKKRNDARSHVLSGKPRTSVKKVPRTALTREKGKKSLTHAEEKKGGKNS